MSDLTTHLLTYNPVDLADATIREVWTIPDSEAANWAFRKLAHAQEELARIKADAAAEIARIQAWADDASRPLESDAAWFTGRLIEYRRRLEDADPTLPKTYRLPFGSITRRKLPDKTVVTDKAAAIAWAQEHAPDAVKLDLLVSQLPDADPETGELVPGVERVVGVDKYDAKPADSLSPF